MEPAPNTALLMFVAHRSAEVRVREALLAAGYELTLAQCRIAQRLSPQGIRVTDIAEQAQVTKQTAGALIDELASAGYVIRRPDPTDARARLVVLTDKGRMLCERAAAEVAAIEDSWREHLGAKAYGQLRDALIGLRAISDPYR